MQPKTLSELVDLWREVNQTPSPPTVFISQKFTETQEDKIDTHVGYQEFEGADWDDPEDIGWVKQSTIRTSKFTTTRASGPIWTTSIPLYTYKRVPPNNTADFQVKPPVKSLFTGISGPYKQV